MQSHRKLFLDTVTQLGLKNYIGYIITTGDKPTLHVPNEHIHQLRKDLKRVLAQCHVKARMLARIAGQCVSMSKAVLAAKLLLCNAYRLLTSKNSWSDILTLDRDTRSDLEWWLHALGSWNGTPIQTGPIDFQIEMDASMSGWGAQIKGSNKMAAGFWNLRLSQMPSNYRELMAVLLALKSFSFPRGKKVQILTDNITTAAYINQLGGPSPAVPKPSTITVSQVGSLRQGTYANCALSSGNTERNGRYAIPPFRPLRVATEQGPIQIFEQSLGPTHSRPVRDNGKRPVTNVQQPLR